jgi:D-3-phosphoglycerate dehydrogenase
MLNKSRDELAYNLIDIGTRPEIPVLEKMRALDGVVNVRLIGDCSSIADH